MTEEPSRRRCCPSCSAIVTETDVKCSKCRASLTPELYGYIFETKVTKHAKGANDFRGIRIRKRTLVDNVTLIYKHINEGFTHGAFTKEDIYSLLQIELCTGNPPKLVYLPKGYCFDFRQRSYVLEPLSEEDYKYLEENIPHHLIAGKIRKIASEHRIDLPKDVAFTENWLRLLSQLKKINESAVGGNLLLFKAGVQIPPKELEKALQWDWSEFVDSLLYMGAERKDSRIVLVAKANMTPQFPEMAKKNSMTVVITNPGTSKSVTFSRFGEIVTRTTQKSITGGAKSNGSIVESFLMTRRYPIVIEHLEAKAEENLLTYLITAISGLPSKIVVWQQEREFTPFCALIINGNPNREKGQPDFEVFFTYLQGISANYIALGRRIGIIAYGRNYDPVKAPRDIDAIPWIRNAWIVWKEVVRLITPLIKEVYFSKEIGDWINTPDPQYNKDVEDVFSLETEYVAVKDFFLEHGINAYPAIKWRAFSCSVVDHGRDLLRLILNKENLDEGLLTKIFERAKSYYEEIKALNYESIRNIAETTQLDQRIQEIVFQVLPRYLREFLITVGNYAVNPERAKVKFAIEKLNETFDEIKNEITPPDGKTLYSGFSVIIQSFDRYKPHLRYASKLNSLGVAVSRISDIWVVRLTPPVLKSFISLLSALSLLSLKYTPTLPKKLFYEEEIKKAPLQGQDLINKLRQTFKRGTQKELEDLIIEYERCNGEEATNRFNKLVDDGAIFMDSDGYWRWA